MRLCSRIKTSEKCGVMVGVGRNRGCFKPPLSSRPALWFLSCCRERNAPAASRKKSQIERYFCIKNVEIEQRQKWLEGEDVLLPQSASLTAPSEMEPDNALSGSIRIFTLCDYISFGSFCQFFILKRKDLCYTFTIKILLFEFALL